jgi:hypothetical protein
MPMRAVLAIVCLLPLLMLAMPAAALTRAQKMETCKFGADDQKLTGAKRNAFIKRCMADEPRKKTTAAKPAAPAAPPQPQPIKPQ